MTVQPKSGRSPLRWSAYPPGSISTDAEGRQRAPAHREGVRWNSISGSNQKQRTLHGFTPYPTVPDGYEATVSLRLLPSGGIRIVSIELRASQRVIEGGILRARQPAEESLSPIDSAAWSLIRISDIKKAIATIDDDVAAVAPRLREEVDMFMRLAGRRRSLKIEERQARWAEQVLQAMASGEGVAYRALLPGMFVEDWAHCADETIKQRVRRLRKDGWLAPSDQYGRPGPRLIAWREQHGDPSTREK